MKLFKLLIIPLLLTIGYFILVSYPYFFSKINRFDSLGFFSSIEELHVDLNRTFSKDRTTDNFDNRLFKGEKIAAKIKASENNLGIILFRFAKLSSKVTDSVTFRIKKEGERIWHYEHTYRADQFQPDEYFTFGFSPFANSKNTTYEFEIESQAGTYKNGTAVSLKKPHAALVYKYNLNDLKDYDKLLSFVTKKTIYVTRNADFLANWQLLAILLLPYIVFVFIPKKKIRINTKNSINLLPSLLKNNEKIIKTITKEIKRFYPLLLERYLFYEKRLSKILKKITSGFASTKFYVLLLNTSAKKRLAIGLLIFILALTYRFSASLVNQHLFFYAGLGGQGDYDQFIRVATCALNLCPAILGQNFLFESSILGIFYEIFGFTGGLKAYLYFMIIVSSIVATIPYILLSRKSWITIGGIIGSLFLATSDFLTWMSLNFPPDNGSLFTFSMFYVVYFLTLQKATVRWLIFFGLMGTIDGLNKALFLINDLAAFALFVPVFLYEKAKKISKFPFVKLNSKLILYSVIPLLVFLLIYSTWEYFVFIQFSAYYFLRGLFSSGGKSYVIYTSFDESSLTGNILLELLNLGVSTIVMLKRLNQYADLKTIFLVPIFLGLFFSSFIKAPRGVVVRRLVLISIFWGSLIALLTLIKNNYFKIHETFAGEYISGTWFDETYIGIFLISQIIIFFVINIRYSSLRLSLPIIPYVIMLIFMAKNAPFARLHTHVVAWSVILLAFLIDFLMMHINKYWATRARIMLGSVLLILFIYVYMIPKTTTMFKQLNSGAAANLNQVRYLKWVEGELPNNTIILAGGKSDLVTIAENLKRPIVYSTLWNGAVLIKPKENPGVKATDFHALSVLKINEIPGVRPDDFSIVRELTNKDNFKKNKYIILEDDIYLWQARVSGIADNVFSTDLTTLHADNYSIKVHKFNPTLDKAIYELNLRDKL